MSSTIDSIKSTLGMSNAKEFKLNGISSLSEVKDGQLKEAEVEGIENGKVLLSGSNGSVYATSSKCTHYGAPLKNGVVTSAGRLTCPWHGACFNLHSGEVEDAPALDPLATYELIEKDGAVYVKGDENLLKSNFKNEDLSCSVSGAEKVLIVGGGSGAIGAMEGLRRNGFKGSITVLSAEGTQPFDRPKLSKALIPDVNKVAFRSADFYKKANIDIQQAEVTSIDFDAKSVSTKAGKEYPYTKLILATGGTPKSLPLQGLKEGELGNVFLLRTVSHVANIMDALGEDTKKVVVIGSSFIGMEVANALAGKKHDVSVIGMESAPTEAAFGAKVGNVFKAALEKNGVKFYMNAQVSHATPKDADKGKVGAVHLKDGTELPADVVIEGVGVGPATKFLSGSKGAPSTEKDGSIVVDETFAVKGMKDVYAVGDIAKYPYNGHDVRIEHWNVAQNAGRAVSKVIAQPNSKPRPFVPIFWSALGSQLRYCGHTGAGYDDVMIDGDTSKPAFVGYYFKGDDVVAVCTQGRDPVMVKTAELMRMGKMLSRKDIEAPGGTDRLLATPV